MTDEEVAEGVGEALKKVVHDLKCKVDNWEAEEAGVKKARLEKEEQKKRSSSCVTKSASRREREGEAGDGCQGVAHPRSTPRPTQALSCH